MEYLINNIVENIVKLKKPQNNKSTEIPYSNLTGMIEEQVSYKILTPEELYSEIVKSLKRLFESEGSFGGKDSVLGFLISKAKQFGVQFALGNGDLMTFEDLLKEDHVAHLLNLITEEHIRLQEKQRKLTLLDIFPSEVKKIEECLKDAEVWVLDRGLGISGIEIDMQPEKIYRKIISISCNISLDPNFFPLLAAIQEEFIPSMGAGAFRLNINLFNQNEDHSINIKLSNPRIYQPEKSDYLTKPEIDQLANEKEQIKELVNLFNNSYDPSMKKEELYAFTNVISHIVQRIADLLEG
jgi:hypothetical protein